MTVRWIVARVDSSETYTFEQNPTTMTSPFAPKVITADTTTAGTVLLTQGARKPHEWSFSGSILTQAFYDALKLWFKKDERLYLTDHYGRQMTIRITSYDPVPKRSVGKPWRHTYDVRALMLVEPT